MLVYYKAMSCCIVGRGVVRVLSRHLCAMERFTIRKVCSRLYAGFCKGFSHWDRRGGWSLGFGLVFWLRSGRKGGDA